jgi:hypothetical protein
MDDQRIDREGGDQVGEYRHRSFRFTPMEPVQPMKPGPLRTFLQILLGSALLAGAVAYGYFVDPIRLIAWGVAGGLIGYTAHRRRIAGRTWSCTILDLVLLTSIVAFYLLAALRSK